MKTHEIETESLPAHVSICQERYRALESRMINFDEKIDAINVILREIRQEVVKLQTDHHTRWNLAQISTISVCIAIISMLVSHIWL
jgi:hypothetical protein